MSEPVLKAMMQLFALISEPRGHNLISNRGRDVVRLFLSKHLNNEAVQRHLGIFNDYVVLYHTEDITRGSLKERKHTSLTAMRILAICEKINEELLHNQKLYVLIQLMDFIRFSAKITENELDFLETVSSAFNIDPLESRNIKYFIFNQTDEIPEKNKVLVINNRSEPDQKEFKHLFVDNLIGNIFLLFISSTNTYILRYSGNEDVFLNGQNLFHDQTYVLDQGSVIKSPGIKTIYYNDLTTVFTKFVFKQKASLVAFDVCLRFKNSDNGIQEFNFKEESGNLVGVLGGSGVGKTTLLNVLSGITKPQSGDVLINGYNLYSEKEKDWLKGVIGFVPQDDLLIDELTVFQNLYYSARLSLDNLSRNRLTEVVNKTLSDLDLNDIRDLKVGNPLHKIISGGQRKRLNIALEIIREPTILFVDEPTSGLSSVDSEIVMNLLKEHTYRGKLVIINIHQPGSDIYKMFDKIMIIDKGGYQIFYGNPSEAIVYFKENGSYANADEDRCIECGNVNTDELLRIIETKVINENGKPTPVRKVTPQEWAEKFLVKTGRIKQTGPPEKEILPENFYSIPGRLKQSGIFFIRDILAKLANKQYVLINLLGAPLLAFLLAYFTRYSGSNGYVFSENENLPSYIFMCVITSLFLGLMVSAEEIVRDRKILRRESLLDLSWFSYLNSKVLIMFLISAFQTISFILIGNAILEIKGMTLSYWIILFTTSCFANMLGLNISSAFNSVITIYILIPFIIIPQLLFSGVLVKYDKLHLTTNSSREFVPVIGDLMAVRWSFEALAVTQFKDNDFQKNFFTLKMEESEYAYHPILINELFKTLDICREFNDNNNYRNVVNENFRILNHHLNELEILTKISSAGLKNTLNVENFNPETDKECIAYLTSLKKHFTTLRNRATLSIDSVSKLLVNKMGLEAYLKLQKDFENKRLKFFVLGEDNINYTNKTPEKIIRKYEPGYMKATSKYGRSHFYAPLKFLGGKEFDTFSFNVLVLWLVTLFLYIILYLKLVQKTAAFLGNIKLRKFLTSISLLGM